MKKIFITTFIIFISLCIIVGTKVNANDFTGLDGCVDISPNDDRIVFSYYKQEIACIYTSKIDGTDVKQLTFSNEKDCDLYPVYSPDGSKIMFVSTPKEQGSLKSSIWIMDANGKNKKEILKADGFVNRVIFSPNEDLIYFSKAQTYQNYSPIARKTYHDFDIYSIDTNTNKVQQITFDKSYNLENLGITSNKDALMFQRFDEIAKFEESTENIYKLYLDGSKKIENIEPVNISKRDLYRPVLSKKNNNLAAFVAIAQPNGSYYYDIFTMNLQTKECRQVTNLKSDVVNTVFFHKSDKILFAQDVNWPKNHSIIELYILSINNNSDINTYKIEKVDIDIYQNKMIKAIQDIIY